MGSCISGNSVQAVHIAPTRQESVAVDSTTSSGTSSQQPQRNTESSHQAQNILPSEGTCVTAIDRDTQSVASQTSSDDLFEEQDEEDSTNTEDSSESSASEEDNEAQHMIEAMMQVLMVIREAAESHMVSREDTPTPPVPDEDKTLESRLLSFEHWPLWAPFDTIRLAEQGYRYMNKFDYVRCDECDMAVLHFDPEDEDPVFTHERARPNCNLVKEYLKQHPEIQEERREQPDVGIPRDRAFWVRCETFRKWPVWSEKRPHDLASYGYIYSGERDIVKCSECGTHVANWEGTDCSFMSLIRHKHDCGFVTLFFGENPDQGKWGLLSEELPLQFKEPGFWERWKTFASWPRQARKNPLSLIRNGFIYTQQNDMVMCEACGGEVNNWHANDDVMVRHLAVGKNCSFLASLQCTAASTVTSSKLPELKQQLKEFSAQKTASIKESPTELPPVCSLCLSDQVAVVFQTCMHAVVCSACAHLITECPICRAPILNKETVYFCNDNLNETPVCMQCGKEDASRILEPCRHMGICDNCVDLKSCPRCHLDVKKTEKVFLT